MRLDATSMQDMMSTASKQMENSAFASNIDSPCIKVIAALSISFSIKQGVDAEPDWPPVGQHSKWRQVLLVVMITSQTALSRSQLLALCNNPVSPQMKLNFGHDLRRSCVCACISQTWCEKNVLTTRGHDL